ncbi:MAG: efflux RND transporter permease subunit [Pseudomonadota bacterium]
MLINQFLQRPVLAISLCTLIVVMGSMAFNELPVRHYPLLPTSEVTITTVYPGASPSVMEEFITVPMQRALSGLDGLDYMTASNTYEQSVITLKFFIGSDVDALLPQISNRVDGLMWELPIGTNSPVVQKIDPNASATAGILYLESNSDTLNRLQITEYLTNVVIPKLETVPGVYEVNVFGGRHYAMRIWLLPHRMAAHGVSATDIYNALEAQNLRSTTGSLYGEEIKIQVETSTSLETVEDFNNVVVASDGDRLVRIKDIGYAEFGSQDYESGGVAQDKPTVFLGVSPTDTANAIQTADTIIAKLDDINADAPKGFNIEPNWNVTKFSKESIDEVYRTFVESGIFVFIVIFAFLGSLRSIIVPLVTIPLSMLGAAAIMYTMGYSLNALTLLAWVLAIGLVVDDSIVVLENIHRHMEQGMTRFQASLTGVKELKFAIVTITLAVAIVFAPIAFVPGFSGALFKEFALTMSFVVLISGLLALFVTPVMCTYLLKPAGHQGRLTKVIDAQFRQIRLGYRRILNTVLKTGWLVLLVFVGLIAGAIKLFDDIPSELMPIENTGALNTLGLGPSDTNYEYLEKYTKPIIEIYKSIPEAQSWGLINGNPQFGATNSISWILLKPQNERKRSEDEVLGELQGRVSQLPGLQAFSFKLNTVPGGAQQPLTFVLKTQGDYDDLSLELNKLLAALAEYPGISNPNSTFRIDKPQLQVTIDRQKAAALGVAVDDIATTLNAMMGRPVVGFFGKDGYSYEVIPQVPNQYRMNPEDINTMFVKNASGQMISLDNVVDLHETVIPQSLDQFDQMRSASLTASIGNGYTLSEAIAWLENYVDTQMPPQYSGDFMDEARDFLQAGATLAIAFAIALVLIYLLLAIHFDSLLDPLVVMLSVPLALGGALFAMYMTDTTLNIYTKIGLIMLVGLISKNGILIVDFSNALLAEGRSVQAAIVRGAATRLRPILMTAFAMIFGALPLVLSDGAGSIARNQIGWVIIGGMSLGTILTLFVVPCAYLVVNKYLIRDDVEQPKPSTA